MKKFIKNSIILLNFLKAVNPYVTILKLNYLLIIYYLQSHFSIFGLVQTDGPAINLFIYG
jgi:hypothetical protein